MKKLKSISLIFLIFPIICWGENFGFVNSVKGKAFLVDKYGNTKILKRGDGLEFNSQVFVEENGQLTFADYNDRQYDLASEGHLHISKGLIEISKGFLRIKSKFPTRKVMKLKTANSQTSFTYGEGILSYDSSNASTQLLSIDGHFNFKNPFLVGSNIEVYGGQFSVIQGDLAGGQPQTPAKIGDNSLNLISSEFYQKNKPSRTVASLRKPSSAKGKIIFIPLEGRKKAVKLPKLKEKSSVYPERTEVKIRIFGQKGRPKVRTRKMASEDSAVDSLIRELKAVK